MFGIENEEIRIRCGKLAHEDFVDTIYYECHPLELAIEKKKSVAVLQSSRSAVP